MTKKSDERKRRTAHDWHELLKRGDGAGLVPVEIARELHAAGLVARVPEPRRGGTDVMVRLKG